jgi:hypothetical protein
MDGFFGGFSVLFFVRLRFCFVKICSMQTSVNEFSNFHTILWSIDGVMSIWLLFRRKHAIFGNGSFEKIIVIHMRSSKIIITLFFKSTPWCLPLSRISAFANLGSLEMFWSTFDLLRILNIGSDVPELDTLGEVYRSKFYADGQPNNRKMFWKFLQIC